MIRLRLERLDRIDDPGCPPIQLAVEPLEIGQHSRLVCGEEIAVGGEFSNFRVELAEIRRRRVCELGEDREQVREVGRQLAVIVIVGVSANRLEAFVDAWQQTRGQAPRRRHPCSEDLAHTLLGSDPGRGELVKERALVELVQCLGFRASYVRCNAFFAAK